ncbi:hypothetical protein DFQ30_003883 [Apophysomyces sp. BC1015]|nr:hypothetical protein DFQ30_003883 [Apophysomyces sp. BC1015]KAG0178799.1 hypothetical protein DFQ29_003011 [Apophysomyces sp. BC1021]
MRSSTPARQDVSDYNKVRNHVKAIENEAGEHGLVKTLEAMMLLWNPNSKAEAQDVKKNRNILGFFAVTPSSLVSGAAWTAKALLANIENTLGLTPQNTKAIKEVLFNFTFAQQKVLAQGLIERLLSRDYPTNDRENTFENVMAIFAKAGQNQQEIISLFTNSLTQAFYDDIQKPYLNVLGNQFRSADGSGNSVLFPATGMAGTPYVRTVSTLTPVYPNLPDPYTVFDRLLKRPEGRFDPHENEVNVLLFYVATIITHDLFYSDPKDSTKNMTTGYADLSPLYGNSKEAQESVRMMKHGLLKPDQWADKRLIFQPAGVGALLVLFSRNHNYIAQQLLERNENGQFSCLQDSSARHARGASTGVKTYEEQDELLFQTARLINNRCYTNIILHEYLRTILGASGDSDFTFNPLATPAYPVYGNQVSIEFNYVYRWHASIGKKDEQWLNKLMSKLESTYGERSVKNSQDVFNGLIHEFNETFVHASEEELKKGNPISGVHRNIETGQFSDHDLTQILHEGYLQVAGRLGSGLNTPGALRDIEVAGINQSRRAKTCTFNDFRAHFNLMPLQKFSDFSDDKGVQEALKELYGEVKNVELFTGLRVEKSVPTGLHLPYTMKRAILSDAVNLLRNGKLKKDKTRKVIDDDCMADRILTQSFTPAFLTNWGMEYSNGDPENHGRVLPTMLKLLLPKGKGFSKEEISDIFRLSGKDQQAK